MPSRRIAVALSVVLAALCAASATPAQQPASVTVTTFVITGRGWGHGVGMSQWGAYGYAKRGAAYDAILAHYYPGTALGRSGAVRIKVLLAEQRRAVIVSSAVPFRLRDGAGVIRPLEAGNYRVGPGPTLKATGATVATLLTGPLTFLPGKGPLWLSQPYRGSFVVTTTGKTLSVVNVVGLESYLRGVVSSEMPRDWPLEAVKAQAVAARSYALFHRRGGSFDVYADVRDQVYGGIAAETPVGNLAVERTRRQVLLYDGKVANTFFFSSSGGRTASVTDVFTNEKPVPYLVSVRDPYDVASPYHTWGPVVVPAASVGRKLHVPGLFDLRPVPEKRRARTVIAVGRKGEMPLRASDLRAALDLRSTWIRVGVLSLSRAAGDVVPGSSATLTGRVESVDGAVLEQRLPGGDWQPAPAPVFQADGTFSLSVAPAATTQYRLVSGPVRSGVLRLVVSEAS